MKIGFDAKRLYGNFTGLGNYSRTLVKNLQQFYPDNEYHLYTPRINQNLETDKFKANPAFHTFLYEGKLKSVWRSYSMVTQLERDGMELFHGLSNELPFGIQKSRVKSVVTIHDLIFKLIDQISI